MPARGSGRGCVVLGYSAVQWGLHSEELLGPTWVESGGGEPSGCGWLLPMCSWQEAAEALGHGRRTADWDPGLPAQGSFQVTTWIAYQSAGGGLWARGRFWEEVKLPTAYSFFSTAGTES